MGPSSAVELYPGMAQLVFLLSLAFTIWMIVDALKRDLPLHWWLILLLFSPIGAIIYFFVIKIRDYDLRGMVARRATHPPLSELRHRALEAPSAENSLALADGLRAREKYSEAVSIYQRVLDSNADDKQALHGLARCHSELGDRTAALDLFGRLMELDRSYDNYSAALEYAETLWADGERQDALDLLEALSAHTRRMNHEIAFAHYLALDGQRERAREVLEHLLESYDQKPPAEQQRQKKWAGMARKMLAEQSE